MFNNIGGKIKTLAEVACWIGIVCSLFNGMALYHFFNRTRMFNYLDGGNLIVVFVFILVGSLVSWIGSFLLYGFGQLIENSDIIAGRIQSQNSKETMEIAKNDIADSSVDDDTYIDIYCPSCGERLSYSKKLMGDNNRLKCPFCDSSFPSPR